MALSDIKCGRTQFFFFYQNKTAVLLRSPDHSCTSCLYETWPGGLTRSCQVFISAFHLWRKLLRSWIQLTSAIWRIFTCGVWTVRLTCAVLSPYWVPWMCKSRNVGSSYLTVQFGCVPALKKWLMVATAAYFCESYVALAVIVQQINWDMS